MTALAEALRGTLALAVVVPAWLCAKLLDIADMLHGYACRALWRTGRLVGYWVERLWGDR